MGDTNAQHVSPHMQQACAEWVTVTQKHPGIRLSTHDNTLHLNSVEKYDYVHRHFLSKAQRILLTIAVLSI